MAGTIRSGEREVTQQALFERAARAASGFHSLGVRDGDAVGLMLRNDLSFFEAHFAVRTLGAYPVPINWHFQGEEAGYILRDAGAKALVIHADLLPQAAEALPDGLPVLVAETPPEIARAYGLNPGQGRVREEATDWASWLEGFEPWAGPAAPERGSMIYTSGSTGQPKGVRREPMTPEQFQKVSERLGTVMGLSPDMRAVVTGPLYHSAPNAYATFSIMLGGTLVLQPRFDPAELLALIERHRISHLHMVPTMFVRLLRLPEEVKRRHDLSSLRHVVHAAAPCPPEVKRAMIEWWGPVIMEYYGSTESGAVVFCDAEQWLARPGTVGTPLPDCTVRILDDDGKPLPTGERGEIYMRNRGLPDFTYHGKDDKRREIERDGLITSGDVGYLDEGGYLFLCDRKIDMVISGGVNIYPAEIEAALVALPGVLDCAVFGIPDSEYGESLMAAVQPEPGARLSESDVRAFLAGRLAGYKIPRRIEFLSELPREDSGKIFKRKLRDPYWRDAGRAI